MFWKKKKERKDLDLVFEKTGHKFYVFKDVTSIPVNRIESLYYKMEEIKLGIRRSDLLVFNEMIKEHVNNGDLQAVAALNSYLGILLQQEANLKPALSLASVVILIDDEPLDRLTPEHQSLKSELIEKYDEIADFFCHTSCNLLKSFDSEMNDTEFLEALKNPHYRQIENLFLKGIGSTSSRSI